MNVVGKVGSLISQGVYSVATPFHPFGGAIDVIVVKQQDGSFRSTPWYVRFGKFQGVLKGAEKFVRISVNGTEADFHMYLDNSGEAYFIREVDSGSISSSEGNNSNETNGIVPRLQHSISDTGVNHLRGGLESLNRIERTESDGNRRYYDFQDDLPSPTSEYGSARFENLNVESYGDSQGSDSVVLVSGDGHVLTAPVSMAEQEADNLQLDTPQFHLAPGDGTEFCEGNTEFALSETSWDAEYISKVESSDANVELEKGDNTSDAPKDFVSHTEKGSYDTERDFVSHTEQSDSTQPGENVKSEELAPTFEAQNLTEDESPTEIVENYRSEDEVAIEMLNTTVDGSELSTIQIQSGIQTTEEVQKTEEGDLTTDSESKDEHPTTSEETAILINNQEDAIIESEDHVDENAMDSPAATSDRVSTDSRRKEDEQLTPSNINEEDDHVDENAMDSPAATSSIHIPQPDTGYELSLCKDELREGMGVNAAAEVFDAHRISMEEYKLSATLTLESENLVVRIGEMYLSWKKASRIVLGKVVFDLDLEIQPDDVISVEEKVSVESKDDETVVTPSSSGRRWRLWPIPFRRVKTIEHTSSNSSSEEDLFVDSEPGIHNSPDSASVSESRHESPRRQLVRTNVPTSEQIASLNLKDGQNMVTFSFSTRVLGTRQADAHIYLWKWDSKIVISDVDGTITKSDVLGKFMPLFGKDWTQTGVAKLFCAIKL